MSMSGLIAAFYRRTADASSTFTEEELTDSGDHVTFQQPTMSKRWWDDSQALTVEKDAGGVGSWSTITTGFTVQYMTGSLIFSPALDAGDKIRVSGKRFTVEEIGGAFEWSLKLNQEFKDYQVWDGGPWRYTIPIGAGFEASVKEIWVDSHNWDDFGEILYAAFFEDDTTTLARYMGKGLLKGWELQADGILSENIYFTGTEDLEYATG